MTGGRENSFTPPCDAEFGEGTTVIIDSGVLIACGGQKNAKSQAFERFARRSVSSFIIPERVHAELGGAPEGFGVSGASVDIAIETGWLSVADDLNYSNSDVASAMDDVRTFIADRTNRDEDTIEKADAALGGLAIQLLTRDAVRNIVVLTTDRPAGAGVGHALSRRGYGDSVTVVDGFDFIDEYLKSDVQ